MPTKLSSLLRLMIIYHAPCCKITSPSTQRLKVNILPSMDSTKPLEPANNPTRLLPPMPLSNTKDADHQNASTAMNIPTNTPLAAIQVRLVVHCGAIIANGSQREAHYETTHRKIRCKDNFNNNFQYRYRNNHKFYDDRRRYDDRHHIDRHHDNRNHNRSRSRDVLATVPLPAHNHTTAHAPNPTTTETPATNPTLAAIQIRSPAMTPPPPTKQMTRPPPKTDIQMTPVEPSITTGMIDLGCSHPTCKSTSSEEIIANSPVNDISISINPNLRQTVVFGNCTSVSTVVSTNDFTRPTMS